MFFLKKAQPEQALVRQGVGGTKVSLDKIAVYSAFHRLDVIDLSLKTLTLNLTEANAVLSKDYIKVDLEVLFYIKVSPEPDDIQRVVKTFDTQKLNKLQYLEQSFLPKFEEALRVSGQRFDFADLFKYQEEFRNDILETIGVELRGFSLEDMVIIHLEQTSLDFYNPEDYLESRGKGKVEQALLEKEHSRELVKIEEALKAQEEQLEIIQKENFINKWAKENKIQKKLERIQVAVEYEITHSRKPTDEEVEKILEEKRIIAQQKAEIEMEKFKEEMNRERREQ